LRTTFNHHALTAGLAYPTYYRDLFPQLRDEFTVAVNTAQTAKRGVWAGDATTSDATIAALSSITDDVVILPKLFRRIADYLQLAPGHPSLAGFPAFLARARDRFFVLSTGQSTTGLDLIVEIANGDTVCITRPATDFVFDEK
jgi:hypothetical protein